MGTLEGSSIVQGGSSYNVLTPASSTINIAKERVTTGHLIISTLSDSVTLNVIHLVGPKQIWDRLNGKYNVQSSSCHMALKEKLYSLHLGEDNPLILTFRRLIS